MKRDYKEVYYELRKELLDGEGEKTREERREINRLYNILNKNYDKYDELEEKKGRMSLVTREDMLAEF